MRTTLQKRFKKSVYWTECSSSGTDITGEKIERVSNNDVDIIYAVRVCYMKNLLFKHNPFQKRLHLWNGTEDKIIIRALQHNSMVVCITYIIHGTYRYEYID